MKHMDKEVVYYDTDTGETGRATLRWLYQQYRQRQKRNGRMFFTFSEWFRIYRWNEQINTSP